jgi:hypothetical protein
MGLYVIRVDIGASSFVKIGHTSVVPDKRLDGIATGCPVEPYLVAYDPRAGAAEEADLHRKLHAWRSHREWFHLTGDVRAFVIEMGQVYPADRRRLDQAMRIAKRLSKERVVVKRRHRRIGVEYVGMREEGQGSLPVVEVDALPACPISPTLRPWLVNAPYQ